MLDNNLHDPVKRMKRGKRKNIVKRKTIGNYWCKKIILKTRGRIKFAK